VIHADTATALSKLVGWTIIDSKTIDGYRDPDNKGDDTFEGCDYDRIIIFTDGTGVECSSYSYTYAYRPTAILLGKSVNYNGSQFTMYKMVVGDNFYDVRAVR